MIRTPGTAGEALLLKDGKVSVTRPVPGILVIAMEGSIPREGAAFISHQCTLLAMGAAELEVWLDLWSLRTYDGEVRTGVVEWLVENRPRVKACYAVTQSKLVAMGVSSINLVLRGLIKSHPTSEAFQAALRVRCAAAKTRPMTQMFRM